MTVQLVPADSRVMGHMNTHCSQIAKGTEMVHRGKWMEEQMIKCHGKRAREKKNYVSMFHNYTIREINIEKLNLHINQLGHRKLN